MESGGQIEYQSLFVAWVWSTIHAADRRHLIGPYVSILVRQRKLPLEVPGI